MCGAPPGGAGQGMSGSLLAIGRQLWRPHRAAVILANPLPQRARRYCDTLDCAPDLAPGATMEVASKLASLAKRTLPVSGVFDEVGLRLDAAPSCWGPIAS